MTAPYLALAIITGLTQPLGVRTATQDQCQAIVDALRADLGVRVESAGCFLVETVGVR